MGIRVAITVDKSTGDSVIERRGVTSTGRYSYAIAGDIFEGECHIDSLYRKLSEGGIPSPELVGEFAIYLEDEDQVFLVTDELGTIKWYYSGNDAGFIVTNDLWEIAEHFEVSLGDIDINSVYEILILNTVLNNRTIFREVYSVPRGSVLTYRKKTNTIDIKKYTEIRYTQAFDGSIDDACQHMDSVLQRTVDKIHDCNRNAHFVLSTSGGLDSRVPLPYIGRLEAPECFLIGRRTIALEPFDFKSAKRIARSAGLPIRMVDPFATSVEKKVALDVLRSPNGPSNIMKCMDAYEDLGIGPKDVLITGAHGGLIGGRVLTPSILDVPDRETLVRNLFVSYSMARVIVRYKPGDKPQSLGKNASIYRRSRRVVSRLVRGLKNDSRRGNASEERATHERRQREATLEEFLEGSELIPSEERQSLFDRFQEFVISESEDVEDNLTTAMRYHLYRHTSRGMFESLHGQVKAYSIYMPYVYHFSKTWPVAFLMNRHFVKEFLYRKHPTLAKVPLQNNVPTIKEEMEGKTRTIRYKVQTRSFRIRKLAIQYKEWWNDARMTSMISRILDDDSAFYSYFDKAEVRRIVENYPHSQLIENILKIKLIFDYIENESYKRLRSEYRFREASKF